MSHQPERTEKDCLNCGTVVQGRFCHICGQENVVTKESFFSLLKHFVYDILHFDSKFFDTLKYVLFRPGYLSKLYVQGKRARFLNPIRMYLFTSAIFFLVFFSVEKAQNNLVNITKAGEPLSKEARAGEIEDLKNEFSENPKNTEILKRIALLQDTTKPVTYSDIYSSNNGSFTFGDSSIKTIKQYDSLQNALPAAQRDGWIKQKFTKKMFGIQARYGEHPREGATHFIDMFIHKLSYMLFVSLPVFALILKLLYVRRKNFYYSDHAIFTLHHYIFSFILLLLIFLFTALTNWTGINVFKKLMPVFFIAWAVYLFIAMRTFYGQGWLKTFIKFLLLNVLGLFVLLLLFVVFIFFTLFQL